MLQSRSRRSTSLLFPPAARTIAKMPALIGSGSFGHASMMAPKSGSIGRFSAFCAPDSAPRTDRSPCFSVVFKVGSIPAASTNIVDAASCRVTHLIPKLQLGNL